MQFLIFIIAYPFLWFISILPFPIFYGLSDVVNFLVYHVFGYRKKTVRENLAMALPNLSDAERLVIEKKSYRHLCDMFMETAKTMTISSKEMNKRFVITNVEVIKEYEQKQKSIILLASHYASWEWLLTINQKISFQGVGVYKKINNKYFDKLIKDIRSKYNTKLILTNKTIPYMAQNQKDGVLAVYGLASDQSPAANKIFHWDTFMGIDVPVHTGAEMLAKKHNLNVIYAKVKKVKRGYYEATLIPLTDNPNSVPDYEITHAYLQEVEKQIHEAPEFYFWTHRRWKHRDKKTTA